MNPKHHHIWRLFGDALEQRGLWKHCYSECACGAVEKACPYCDGTGKIMIEKKEE